VHIRRRDGSVMGRPRVGPIARPSGCASRKNRGG